MLYNLRKTSNPCICNSVLHLVMLLFSSCREAFLRPRSSSPTLNRRWTNWENCWKKNETKEWLLRLPLPQPRSRSGGKGPRDTASLHFWPFLILCVCVCVCLVAQSSHVQLSVTSWTAAYQAPLSMGILQARTLEWIAMPSSRESSQPRDQTQFSHIAFGLFTIWATREAQEYWSG